MRLLKSLGLGSAAFAVPVLAAGLAQAADAPKYAAKGKEPVYSCADKGFIEYPGSDICFKIGGSLYTWIAFHEDQDPTAEDFNPVNIRQGTHTANDTLFFGTQARVNLDVRQATQYGVVRVFIELKADDDNTNDGGAFDLRHGFIQFGNFLFGKTYSTLYFGATPETFSEGLATLVGEQGNRVNQARYTAVLGNGVTVSIAIEDPARFDGNFAGLAASRSEVPDIVANIHVKGSWGSAQLSAAAHQQSYIGPAGPNREWGWAGQLGVALGVPGTMGDVVYLQGTYADGFSRAVVIGTSTSLGLTALATVDSVQGYALLGGYKHYWSKTLRSTLGVAFADIDYNAVVVAATSLDRTTVVWANLIWSPVSGLDVGVELAWGQTELLNGVKASAIGGSAQAVKKF